MAAAVALGGLITGLPAAWAAPPTPALLQALETALNSSASKDLAALLEAGPGFDPNELEARYSSLRQLFPDARWKITPAAPLRDGRATVTVKVTGQRQDGPYNYRLEASQQLALESSGSRINGQMVIREQSILRSGDADLPVSLLIPDAVLTGQRYDVDVLFDDPLEGAVAAGGIVPLTAEQLSAVESPDLQLGALGGGGLFKTVQAPTTPGSQTWAILLVHPKGIVSATKLVRVVADRQALQP
ncbi:hypothetical protein KQ310_06535 [Synechococcus sp. CS-1328]|nr:hypothetical protein [Synechococcus sp. CS-1328]